MPKLALTAIAIVAAIVLDGRPARGGEIFTNTHTYAFGGDPGAVSIRVQVFGHFNGNPLQYLWQYTVSNHSYDPIPGQTNGFAGFALALPTLPPDIGNVTGPPNWDHSAGIDVPHAVEWDINDDSGGVMPGHTGVFSFTTLPRPVTIGEGLFHTWKPIDGQDTKQQFAFVNFENIEVPDVGRPPRATPEPGSAALLGLGLLGASGFLGRRVRRGCRLAIDRPN
jgi:hypothetical protein